MHDLYLYFLGLSFRNTSKALDPFEEKGTSHSCCNLELSTAVTLEKEGRISAFVIDETMVQIVGRNETWLLIAIEPVHSTVLNLFIQT
jgi:putative transposase